MNANLKSTLIAIVLVATVSRGLSPVQAHETVNAVLSKSPVAMRSVVYRQRPVYMRIRPALMQYRPVVYLSSRFHTLSVKRGVTL